MITNRSSLWPRAMSEIEHDQDLEAISNSHITSEFLKAEIPCENSFGYCDVCGRTDPFCPHQTARSAPVNGATTSNTGTQPWGTPIASREPCPTCGERPWWSYQDACISAQQDEDETLGDMYDWK